MILRTYQEELLKICQSIRIGQESRRNIIINAFPGSGKSYCPVIVASQLITQLAQKICWIVPRTSLKIQGARSFLDPDLRQLLHHNLEIRESENDINPSRGTAGYIMTYQGLMSQPQLHIDEFKTRNYILVFDEAQHLQDEKSWWNYAKKLIDRAKLVIYMSGTPERPHGERLSWWPYENNKQVLTDTKDFKIINYPFAEAYKDKSVLPFSFVKADGKATWIKGDTLEMEKIESIKENNYKKNAPGLWTALNTEFAHTLLHDCYEDWNKYKNQNNRAKMLVIAPRQNIAREYLKRCQQFGAKAAIAVSDDNDEACSNIERFKTFGLNSIDILVTVQMAYEGLDVPSVSHIACLTHIRSRPWIIQAISRANRVDRQGPEYGQQVARVYVPDDPSINEIIDYLKNGAPDGAISVNDILPNDLAGEMVTKEFNPIVPITSAVTAISYEILPGKQFSHFDFLKLADKISNETGVVVSPEKVKSWCVEGDEKAITPKTTSIIFTDIFTVREKEKHMRKILQDLTNKGDTMLFEKHKKNNPNLTPDKFYGKTNSFILNKFHKNRKDMTLDELKNVHSFLIKFLETSSFP